MRKLLLLAVVLLVLIGGVSHWHRRPLAPPPGVLAPDDPVQVDLDHGATLQRGDVTLVTRAHFDITARVLSREDYSWGADGKLIPEDLALGWGRMSDSACSRTSTSASPAASITGMSNSFRFRGARSKPTAPTCTSYLPMPG